MESDVDVGYPNVWQLAEQISMLDRNAYFWGGIYQRVCVCEHVNGED